ncbi:hypothetical protein T11_8279 [Trichinella zimbabwensis]|uniref:Uncharacterized protein n=1 Tax=Trichinella zimbabwensis TaxID=268475 RepID=A0A0V1GCH9_9BILA|nr:hypothetical protein T11_12787 [Trichinella zimbabwensis]KRY97777.1 hypothetical protein T11_8279 [Trichinella zimbabwensis]
MIQRSYRERRVIQRSYRERRVVMTMVTLSKNVTITAAIH